MAKNDKLLAKLIPHQDPEDRIVTPPVDPPQEEDRTNRHTPGPWVYYNARADQNGTPVYTLTSLAANPAFVTQGVWIADIRMGRPNDDIGWYEGRANARLIASAPDLLGACLSALNAIGAWCHWHHTGFHDLSQLHGVLASAVARATPIQVPTLPDRPNVVMVQNGGRSELHYGVLAVWDEDRDERIKDFIRDLPEDIRSRLLMAHEHEASLWLTWAGSIPEDYKEGCEVEIDMGADDDGNPVQDYWTIMKSEAIASSYPDRPNQ